MVPPPDGAVNGRAKHRQKVLTVEAWASNAELLADWTMQRFVNRTDAWVRYLPLDERTDNQKARTAQGSLTREKLARHFRGAKVSDLFALHTTSADNTSRWVGIDIDHHGERDATIKRRNRKAALTLYKSAKDLGFRPLLFASNGRGGYHLVILFN